MTLNLVCTAVMMCKAVCRRINETKTFANEKAHCSGWMLSAEAVRWAPEQSGSPSGNLVRQADFIATCASAGNDVLLVGFASGAVRLLDFARAANSSEREVQLSSDNAAVASIFLDPSGNHAVCICTDRSGRPLEAHHISTRSNALRARSTPKLKALSLTAIGWNRHAATRASSGLALAASSSGILAEVLLEDPLASLSHSSSSPTAAPSDAEASSSTNLLAYYTGAYSPERWFKHLPASVSYPKEEVLDCRLEVVGQQSHSPLFFVFVASPTRLFATSVREHISALKSLGEPVATSPERVPPSVAPSSSLRLWASKDGRRPDCFAWLRSDGVLTGSLSLSAASASAPTAHAGTSSAGNAIAAPGRLITLPEFDSQLAASFPVGIGVAEFHVFLLYAHEGMHALNMLSGEWVEALPQRRLGGTGERSVCLVEEPSCSGNGTGGRYVLTSSGNAYEVGAKDEARDMWWLHVERGEYARALELARNQEQREKVHLAQAEAAIAKGDNARAAAFYARAGNAAPFESISLRLFHDRPSLRLFLLHKLDRLGQSEKAQATMLATWLAELYLEDSNVTSSGAASDEFRSFLEDHRHELDSPTTRRLLAEHGMEEELVLFASLTGDHETVISHHIGRGDAEGAIAAMRKPGVPASVKYRHAPALVELDPTKAVDFFISAGSSFDARLLLPSLTRTGNDAKAQLVRAEATRLLEHWIRCSLPGSSDPSVCNFLITLHAQRGDERAVLQCIESPLFAPSIAESSSAAFPRSTAAYAQSGSSSESSNFAPGKSAQSATGKVDNNVWNKASIHSFDKEHALRACLENGCMIAAVSLYASLGAYEEAVELALRVDSGLAKRIADKPEGDDALRRSLWLQIARAAISKATPNEEASYGDETTERDGSGGARGQSKGKKQKKKNKKNKGEEAQDEDQQQVEGDLKHGHQDGSVEDANSQQVDAMPERKKPSAGSVREAVAVLQEADGLLRVEDVLPLFPDFTRVGDFKQAVVQSLEEYNQQIESLRQEVRDATSTAESIRSDIERLRKRTMQLSRSEPCASCSDPVVDSAAEGSLPAFYAFPCGMAFHSQCLAGMLVHEMGSHQKQRANELLGQSKEGDGHAAEELERLIAHECPLCGDRAINGITEPFVRADEDAVAQWKLESTGASSASGTSSPPHSGARRTLPHR